jgi:glycine dehydrogenase
MMKVVGVKSLEELMKLTVPEKVLDPEPYKINGGEIPEAESESILLKKIQTIAQKNKLNKCYIGGGYYGTITPQVVARNVLENPNWYTAYTPYQGEISQGRLEAILNYQTLCTELAGLEVANASLLDEGTACAEAMMMCYSSYNQKRHTFFIAENVFPQSIDVVRTRAENADIKVIVGNPETFDFSSVKDDIFGILLQTPDVYGILHNYKDLIEKLRGIGGKEFRVALAADPMALLKTINAGEQGADICIGSMQRYGVPMGFGGPHAAFMVTQSSNIRKMPGRLIGISKDRFGDPVFRMTLQTREQHIKREKATSNICTAQVLLANIASFYATYHGKEVIYF